jgi:diphthine synthase
MIATTHVDLRVRAIRRGIPTKIIHSGSIITAAPGLLGLQNYKFGRTTTLPFPVKEYFPTSPYGVILDNKNMGLHTLILLDIQADKDMYMTANDGLKLLLKMEEKIGEQLFDKESIVCVVARAGSPKPIVEANSIKELLKRDFGDPLHSLIVPGALHFMEIEALKVLAGLPQILSEKLQKV